MSYAESNYSVCPKCQRQGIHNKCDAAVTAIACMYCGYVVELETDRQAKMVKVAGELELECICGQGIPLPSAFGPGKTDLPPCVRCGQVWQVWHGPKPVQRGFTPWKRPQRA